MTTDQQPFLLKNDSVAFPFTDDFNWPSPQRKDTMYLRTLESSLSPKKCKPLLSLTTKDIDGATFVNKSTRFMNKVDFVNRTDDIFKPYKSNLTPHGNKPDLQLKNDDIQGSRSSIRVPNRFTRHTNPLCPEYVLASVEYAEPPPLKFIRDTLSSIDLPASSFSKNQAKLRQRQPALPPTRQPKRKFEKSNNSLQVRDINYPKPELDPLNLHKKSSSRILAIQEQPQPMKLNNKSNLCLDISDIEGASSTKYGFHLQQVKQLSLSKEKVLAPQTSHIAMIDQHKYDQTHTFKPLVAGASSGSLRKGITTLRKTNPLAPKYVFPGQSRLSTIERLDSFIS